MVIDLHCDTLTALYPENGALYENNRAVSLKKGCILPNWAQVYAIFLSDELRGDAAYSFYKTHVSYFRQQLALNGALVEQAFTGEQLENIWVKGKAAAILAVENAAALGGRLDRVKELAQDGVRLVTITWNGDNGVASGVGGDPEAGFTSFGKAAAKAFEQAGITLDVSHLNETGFWELCEWAEKPFVATHSNAYAVCSHPRNLTDQQFCEIVRRDGLVGLNFYRNFLNNDPEQAEISDLVRHIHHFLELGGENALCLGSDFDGAKLPDTINSVEKLADLKEFMIKSQISEQLADKILGGNACRFFRRNWREKPENSGSADVPKD